jgi:hypothetical protein
MNRKDYHFEACVEIINNHMDKLYLLELEEDDLIWMKLNVDFYRQVAESLLDLANDVDNMLED